MNFSDVLLLLIRWLHTLAAVAWVGGGVFYLLIVRPTLKPTADGPAEATRRLGEQFRQLVNTAIAVLVVSGTILAVNRLTSEYAGVPYVVVLAVKIGLALYMFYLVRFLRPRTYPADVSGRAWGLQRFTRAFTGATAVLVLGVIVFLLSDILRALIERSIEG